MSCCTHCQESGDLFDDSKARTELQQYRRDGPPNESTRLLIDGLRTLDLEEKTLLDIGGGVGMIQHELLDEGLSASTMVEASRPYLAVAEKEARRRGNEDRASFRYGDFVDLAPELPAADLVTLDRVLCCYPHMKELVRASTEKASRWYGVVYPKRTWYLRWLKPLADLYFWMKDMDFRIYLHDGIERAVRDAGFRPFYQIETLVWKVELYERDDGPPG